MMLTLRTKSLANIIKLFSFLVLITPLLFNGRFFFPFISPKALFLWTISEIIFFIWLYLIFIQKEYLPKFNLVTLSLAFFLFSFLLSSIFGLDPSYSFWSKFERMSGILMQLHLFCFFLVLSSIFDKEDFKDLFVFSIFVATIVGIIGISVGKSHIFRGGGTLGNESFLGSYLLFNLFFALYLFFDSLDWKRNYGLIFATILFFLLLAVGVSLEKITFKDLILNLLFRVGARAAKISFYGGLVFLVLLKFALFSKKPLKIFAILSLIFGTIFVIFVAYSVMFQPESFFYRLIEKNIGFLGGRGVVWNISKKAFWERPFLGYGPENFEFVFIKFFNPCFGTKQCGADVWYDRAHNIIFDTLTSQGLLGIFALIFIYFSVIFTLIKSHSKKKITFWEMGILISLFLSHFVQNLTVFDTPATYLMLFLTLAFVAVLGEGEKEKIQSVIEIPTYKLAVLPILFLIFIFVFKICIISPTIASTGVVDTFPKISYREEKNLENLTPLKAQQTEDKVVFITYEKYGERVLAREVSYLKPNQRINLDQKILKSSPIGSSQIKETLARNALEFYQIYLNYYQLFDPNLNLTKDMEKEFEFLIEELQKEIKKNPLNLRARLALGDILNGISLFNKEKAVEAEKFWQETVNQFPSNQRSYFGLARVLFLGGKKEEAIKVAQKAIDLEPQLKDSHLLLIQLLVASNQEEMAKEKFQEALKIDPTWEDDLKAILQ
jgi:O-antigen ligase